MELQKLSNEIHLAKKAAKESGDLLINSKSEYNLRLNSNSKDTKLKADIKSEDLIKSIITKNSSFPILAEESGKSNDDLGDTFWVIDPLDGSANYNRNIPVCCISIGLVKDMKPILGVIYDFNNDDMYVGDIYSKKSFMNEQIIKTSKISNKEEGILITGLPHDADYSEQALSSMIDDMQKWQKIRMMGSAAMAACFVASGKVEQYQEKGIYLLDIVAGAAIVESSGVTAKIFNQKDNFQVDVVFTNSKI